MDTFAALMTGQAVGAISTIQVFGDEAESVIKKTFKPAGGGNSTFDSGKVLLGTFTDGIDTIDQVTLGCNAARTFTIHCHGNPLITSDIMKLLSRKKIKIVTAEQLKILSEKQAINTIEIEANLVQPKIKTLEGTKIVFNQAKNGLNRILRQWSGEAEKFSLEDIKSTAAKILQNSQTAKLIIYGCKTVIAGPVNSGKSTLLNCLCGREKAIVTDIKGTTRDWVSGNCSFGRLFMELMDTAGLDEGICSNSDDEQSRKKTRQILQKAALCLWVIDAAKLPTQADKTILNKTTIIVLNKSDLPDKHGKSDFSPESAEAVRISAKFATGINTLLTKINQITGIEKFDLKTAVCFTERQEKLMNRLVKTNSLQQASLIITELLNGKLTV